MSQDNKGVWVFSEDLQLAFELLAKAKSLATQLSAEVTAVSAGSDEDYQKLIQHGADKVLAMSNPALRNFQVDTYADALNELVTERKPDILMIGATRNGLEFAPRLAERLKTGCVTEATKLEPDAEKNFVLIDRVTLGGNLTETHVSRAKPQIATITKGLFSPLPADASRNGEVLKVDPKIKPPSTKILESKPKQSKGEHLSEASIIVSFGRGVRKKEDVGMIEQFAHAIGAVVGCSRPIAEDLRWLPEEQYIGLSGQKVSPKVYFALGISGQIQHLTGIRNSRIIVAVNNDPKAPIFEFSDYGIIADLYKAMPALTEAARQLGKT